MLVDAIPLRESGRRLSAAELAALEPKRGQLYLGRGSVGLVARLLYAGPGWAPDGGRMDQLQTLLDACVIKSAPQGMVISGRLGHVVDGDLVLGDLVGAQ